MERPLVCQHLTATLAGDGQLEQWAPVLLQHHRDLRREIGRLRALVQDPGCRLLQLDARLRRLGRAVSMHLELEACFLEPTLMRQEGAPGAALLALRQGYADLQQLLRQSADFVQREKLSCASVHLSRAQRAATVRLLVRVGRRLRQEDAPYRRLHAGRPC